MGQGRQICEIKKRKLEINASPTPTSLSNCMLSLQSRRILPIHGLCTRGVLGVYWTCTERVRLPFISGLTAFTGPSTARPRAVHKRCTGCILNVYCPERVRLPYIPGLAAYTGLSTAGPRPVYKRCARCILNVYWTCTERVRFPYIKCMEVAFSQLDWL